VSARRGELPTLIDQEELLGASQARCERVGNRRAESGATLDPCSGFVALAWRSARKFVKFLAHDQGWLYGHQCMGSKVIQRPAEALADRGKPAAPVREVLNSLRKIVRSLRVSSRAAEQRVGLSGAQLFVLSCLARQSPCSVNELAARTATDQSSVSVVVSRLVSLGHVRRTTSKTDRRSVDLSLTRSGRVLLESAPEAAQDRLIASLSQLPRAELKTLSRLLGKVVEVADVAEQVPSLFFEEGPALVTKKPVSK